MSTTINVSRREFLAVGGGLVLGFALPARMVFAQESPYRPANIIAPPPPGNPNAYIKISTDDSVTFLIAKSEMGQGPATACSQMLAEELECDWSKVRMEFAPVDPLVYGYQTTVGSLAVRTAWEPMRRAGAEAREMLIQAAAARWKVNPSQCRAENSFVINPATGEKINYGSIAEAASKLPVPANVVLKQPKDFKIIGKPVKRLDTRDKITGRATYGIDAVVPGMVYAVVEHCPVFGGKIASFDAAKARAVPGVKDVIELPAGVAVVADSTWAAMQGRRALTVTHDEGTGASLSSASIRQMFVASAARPGAVVRKEGDAERAIAGSTKTLRATYDVQFLAHAPMEPMNCTVHYQGDRADVWVSSQSPTSAAAFIAETLGLPPERVTLHRTHVGGGFGRRGEQQENYLVEAAHIAKQVKAPVKMTWTREDDLRHDYYRPAAYSEMAGALDAAGWPAAMSVKVAALPLGVPRNGVATPTMSGVSDLAYELPHFLVTAHGVDPVVPARYWRAPGPSQNTFAAESFFDELCVSGRKDPVEARRRLLSKNPRLLHVLNVAAEKAGWGKPLPAGHFHGVAIASNIGFNAQVAEVSVTNGRVRVHRVVCAFDCGLVINPAILTQQIEGGILWGLSATLKEEITIARGRVQEVNFNKYDPIRIDEVPAIDVHIVQNTESPVGAGEATTPNAVPAVVNALFAATGKRIRRVPIRAGDFA